MFFLLPTVVVVYNDKIHGYELSWWDCAVTQWYGYDLAQPVTDHPNSLLIHQSLDDDYWEEY